MSIKDKNDSVARCSGTMKQGRRSLLSCMAVAGGMALLLSSVTAANNGNVGVVGDENHNHNHRSLQALPTSSYTYQRRGRPMSDEERNALNEKWGSWSFIDYKASDRPNYDFYSAYPNRDIPFTNFNDIHQGAPWQTDQNYMGPFLQQSNFLVKRAMEAILSEYGHGQYDEETKLMSFEERCERMFGVLYLDKTQQGGKIEGGNAGATTHRSFEGLVRRILHSIMTQDTFTVVMGGHSAAAGHGNHFTQSYTMQIQKVLEPVFARLGVKMTARNIAMGGLGTLQNAMGAASIYGRDIDYLIWDSGMTEKGKDEIDLYFRQSILGSETRVPYIDSADDRTGILRMLHDHADIDVAIHQSSTNGIAETTDELQVQSLPWAAQYLNCAPEMKGPCRSHDNRYNGTCWIPRDDYEPETNQNPAPGGRAGWHPGHREHQIIGRIIAFNILNATYTGINRWLQSDNYQLPDEAWHVKDYYQNMQTKIATLDPSLGACYRMKDKVPAIDKFCTVPFKARTEFTPRANPAETSIRSIMKLPENDAEAIQKLTPAPSVYTPPDVYNPFTDPPIGAINYLQIIENGIDYAPILYPKTSALTASETSPNNKPATSLQGAEPGKGWGLVTKASADDECHGSYDSFCGRSAGNNCLLYGHNDFRGGLRFDSLSGWGIFNLKGVQHGVITFKIETWHSSGENRATSGWTNVNGERSLLRRELQEGIHGQDNHRRSLSKMSSTCAIVEDRNRRELKGKSPILCDDFRFEYSINGGEIKSLDPFEVCAKLKYVQRVVQQITLLNDPNFVQPGEAQDVEVAVRMVGCGRDVTYQLTHIYWA